MKDYIVYFSVFNKKMKVTVRATNSEDAAQIVKNRLKIILVKEDEEALPSDDMFANLMYIFNIKK